MRWFCLWRCWWAVLPFVAGAQRGDVLSFINPFIGTAKSDVFTRWGNEGGTYPGAVAPWGYMQLTPETRREPVRGYDFQDSLIYVFSCTRHSSGFPNGSAGRLFVMPVHGVVTGRRFSHRDEVAEPGYYRVRLADDGTVVEAVATERAGEFRIRFPGGVKPEIFVGDTAAAAFDFSEGYVSNRAVEGGTVYAFSVSTVSRAIVVRISSATAGAASAKRNIDTECGLAFDSLRTAVAGQWGKALSVVEVDDDNRTNKTIFYTALYHSLLVPWVVSDVDGYYQGADRRVHQVTGRAEYGNFSPWDSYRSLHPLLSLLYPGRQKEMIQSLMDEYREGGSLPIESMTGNHVVPIIVDAYLKGIRGVDSLEMYHAMLKSLVHGPFQQDDRVVYSDTGYIPLTYPESVTRTVEYGYDDWVLGQYARRVMGDEKLAGLVLKRSTAYRYLLYTPSLLLLPREGDAFRMKPGNIGYKEGDAWVYSYFAPQDPGGLIDRFGGDVYFSARLDSALRDGRIAFDNETVLHLPYFFNYSGRHDLTSYWVSAFMKERYGNRPGGLPGNDDLGAMSSWYVFSALGFFPFCPGRPEYSVGVPLFRKAVLHLAGGKQFVVRREAGVAHEGPVAGRGGQGVELSHATIVAGGELVFREGGDLSSPKRDKPVFVLSGVAFSGKRVRPGDIVVARFSVGNKGVPGVKRVVLMVGEKAVGSRNCFVERRATIFDSIVFRLYKSGVARVRVGGIDAGVVEVVAPSGPLPAEPAVGALDMRVVVREGDSVRVHYTLQNIGWGRQVYSLPVRVDGIVVGVDSVGLEAGESRERVMGWHGDREGWHELRIGKSVQRYKVYRRVEDAVVFDMDSTIRLGKDAFVSLPRSLSLGDMGERLTLLLWVYPEGAVSRGRVDIFTNGDNYVLQVSGGRQLSFFAGGWGRGDCTVDLPSDWKGHWHLIAGVCDEKGLSVYIDGQRRGFTPLEKSVHLFAGDNTWLIGRNEEFPGERIYEGLVRRPRIFQEALSPEAILTIYRNESNTP